MTQSKVCYCGRGRASGATTGHQDMQPGRTAAQAEQWAEKEELSLTHQWRSGFKSDKLESSGFAGQNGVCLAYGNCQSKWCQTDNFSPMTATFLSPRGAAAGKGMLDWATRAWRQYSPAEVSGICLWHKRSHNLTASVQVFLSCSQS